MTTGRVRMLHFLAFATTESDIFTPPALRFECRSLPFTGLVTMSVFYVVLRGLV